MGIERTRRRKAAQILQCAARKFAARAKVRVQRSLLLKKEALLDELRPIYYSCFTHSMGFSLVGIESGERLVMVDRLIQRVTPIPS